MKPTVKIASTKTPDGSEMVLYQHDQDFLIKVNGEQLMHSRQHESELELARLGCAHLTNRDAPRILVGGLGMGFTLSEALHRVSTNAEVVVSELLGDVIKWNREYFKELNGGSLDSKRVRVEQCDVLKLITKSPNRFDAILLDVDNGPQAVTDRANKRLYSRDGILACREALRDRGCLAFWSIDPSKKFERLMMSCKLHVRRYRAPAYKGCKTLSRFIWVASRDQTVLPPGGGEPRAKAERKAAGGGPRRFDGGRSRSVDA